MGNKTYRRFIRIDGRRLSKAFTRRSDADRWYSEMLRQKELGSAGLSLALELVAFEDFANEWQRRRKVSGRPASSWKVEEQRLRKYILPVMGKRPIQRISSNEWENLLLTIQEKNSISSSTRNRIRALLSKIYNDALSQNIVIQNPIQRIPKLRESPNRPQFFSAEEARIYLRVAATEAPFFKVFAMLALNTGARVGELLALSWADIDLPQRRIHLWKTYEEASSSIQERTKGKRDRWLGINDHLYDALVEFKRISPSKIGPLFANEQGIIARERTIRTIHHRVCEKANLRKVRVHDLRHSYGAIFMMSGGSLYELKEIFGHSSPQTTTIYSHFSPGHLESRAKVVELSGNIDQKNIINLTSHRETVAHRWHISEKNR